MPEKPFCYWAAAPMHLSFSKDRNLLRAKFNLSLEVVIRTKPNMHVMKVKEVWGPKDPSLVIGDKITEHGMFIYWKAVDASLKFNSQRRETFLAKQLGAPKVLEKKASPEKKKAVHEDPMPRFFERHRHVGHYMSDLEDFADRRRVNNRGRFLLPRLRQPFRFNITHNYKSFIHM